MPDILIEQGLYGTGDTSGYQFLARSPGFLDEWLPRAQEMCTGFGDRPVDVACPGSIFALPLDRQHVAVVQAMDLGHDEAGRPGALGFHLLVLSQDAYTFLGGDPFHLAEQFAPPWGARGELPALSCPGQPPPARTVAQIQSLLARFRHMQPTLLGGVQSLVDGGRLVFERSEPDPDLLRCLWTLLPTRTRSQLWPASFAFGNALGFDAVVVPRAEGEEFAGYLHESQAGDYPEGRYELALQVAAESGDQAQLDALFARRSGREVWRLGLILLGVVLFLTLVMNGLSPPVIPPQEQPGATAPAVASTPNLPPPEHYPALNAEEQHLLATALHTLADKLQVPQPLPERLEDLLGVLDHRLGTPDPQRNPGELHTQGPPLRQLRVLLWKHHAEGYDDVRLNPKELVERLEQQPTVRAAGRR